jgi:3-methylcrotonyl-CoA carboxylase alpha subunit
VKTNIPYLKAILSHKDFLDGTMTTQFISKYFPEGLEPQEPSEEMAAFAAAAMKIAGGLASGAGAGAGAMGSRAAVTPWAQGWRFV